MGWIHKRIDIGLSVVVVLEKVGVIEVSKDDKYAGWLVVPGDGVKIGLGVVAPGAGRPGAGRLDRVY